MVLLGRRSCSVGRRSSRSAQLQLQLACIRRTNPSPPSRLLAHFRILAILIQCDAVHPHCAPCLKSHKQHLSTLPPDALRPPYPECVWDDDKPEKPSGEKRRRTVDGSKGKGSQLEAMESKIGEYTRCASGGGRARGDARPAWHRATVDPRTSADRPLPVTLSLSLCWTRTYS